MYNDILSQLFDRFRELPQSQNSAPRCWNPEAGYDISVADIARWSKQLSISELEVFDFLASNLARDFDGGILGWDFCDWAANGLNLIYTDYLLQLPYDHSGAEHFLHFYLAFDGSEQGNPNTKQAIAKTNIEQFLRRLD